MLEVFFKEKIMLLSIALIILVSLFFSMIMTKLKFPALIGMLLTGILLGPFLFNLIDVKILNLSPDLRQIALVVILIRAGLSLDLSDLKKIGRPAILLSFIPATFEIILITILAPLFFKISYLEAAMLGAIIAAVSPAVIVPRMIMLIQKMKGHEKKIPHLILAGASIDDVFVIVVFSALIGIYQGNTLSITSVLFIPISIILGAILGVLSGLVLVWFFMKYHLRDTLKVLILFSFGFLFLAAEHALVDYIAISGLIAVMALGITLLTQYPVLAKRLVGKFEKIWIIAEIMLFVLVGAAIDLSIVKDIGFLAILLITISLFFRMLGVLVALIKTHFNPKEKVFVCISYIPKATVQAAIGAIPLALGVPSGALILTIAVTSILFTAPLGAIMIDKTQDFLLTK
jgi:NhaP-type Na+/H+ or K+/H+ antiporter